MEPTTEAPVAETAPPPMPDAEPENTPEPQGGLQFDDTVDQRPRPTPPRPKKLPPKPLSPDVGREIQLRDNADLADYLQEFDGAQEIKITITRRSPKVGPGGENVFGTLETVEERINNDYIKDMWGGGTFGLIVQIPKTDGSGGFRIVRRMQIALAGEPKMHGRALGQAANNGASIGRDPLVQRAFDMTLQREKEAQQRLIELQSERNTGGLDAATLAALTAPLQNQILELQRQLADAHNKPVPRDELRDDIFKSMLTGDRSEAERIRKLYEDRMRDLETRLNNRYDDAITRHAAQIERLEDKHEAAIKRLEDRHTEELRQLRSQHEREIKFNDSQREGAKEQTKIAMDTRIDNLNTTIKRLEAEIAARDAKVATLEARKDQTIKEKAEELLAVQEVVGGLAGEKGDPKWYEKLIDAVGNSEAAVSLINRVAGGPPQQQQQQQYQLPPAGVPFQLPGDPNVYVMDGQGQRHIVQQRPRPIAEAQQRKKKRRPQQQAGGAEDPAIEDGDLDDEGEDAPPAGAIPAGRPPSEEEIQKAIAFLEAAVGAKDPKPELLARTAPSMIDNQLLTFIVNFENVDDFLTRFAKLKAGSPLLTVKGKQFMRALHKHLREAV